MWILEGLECQWRGNLQLFVYSIQWGTLGAKRDLSLSNGINLLVNTKFRERDGDLKEGV